MALHDFSSQRLCLDAPLSPGARISASPDQANYLTNVLRMKSGDTILVFNGRDGEWRASLALEGKRRLDLVVGGRTRAQTAGPDIHCLFAPLKRARLDYMVQKATEMGAARLVPVITRHTVAERVNLERMRANAIEAAEQCGILHLPEVDAPVRLDVLLDGWDGARTLVFCDEAAEAVSPLSALGQIAPGPLAVLIGPEGGFSAEERARLMAAPWVRAISLGPRILRADTAAVAALALVNAVLGDWH